MIKQLIIALIKKHGLIFILELIKDFISEYKQQSVFQEMKNQYENEEIEKSPFNDLINKFINK